MSPYIERVTLGKILLMQDLNIQSQFVGKSLSDVDFLEILRDKEDVPTAEEHSQPSANKEPSISDSSPDSEDNRELEYSEKKKKKKPNKRQRWSEKETSELNKYFANQLQSKVAPRKEDCIKAKQASFKAGGDLHKRPWHQIVKKISNLNHKKNT